jgi:alkylhydroperoxidase/carboxymuconolactone decarboxylase family protein YurZ
MQYEQYARHYKITNNAGLTNEEVRETILSGICCIVIIAIVAVFCIAFQ